jgi:trk system potassium uptake protein TrkH
MRYANVLKLVGVLLMLFSLSMLPPLGLAVLWHESVMRSFSVSFCITALVGFCLWVPFAGIKGDIKPRDGFLVVAAFWVVLSLFASLPFLFSLYHHINFVNAFFEATSGLTTTGATVLTNLDHMPRALLYYRQQLHFLGGMGIIILALAVMPLLGAGSMSLYRAEASGPFKNDKMRPRLAETAKSLWYIYVGLTIACAFAYWLVGMQPFDAIGEAFSTVSTGGFTMHDQSFAYYHSMLINSIAMIFMLIGATSFTLHFHCLWNRDFKIYFKDPETKSYLKLLLVAILIVSFILFVHQYYTVASPKHLIDAVFTVVSISTTTGFQTTNYVSWPTFLPFLIIFLALIGGGGGSTAGGIKVARALLLGEQGKREVIRMIHPGVVRPIKLGNQVIDENVIQAIWGFFAIYTGLFFVLLMLLLSFGLEPTTAFSALSACISNAGESIGLAGYGFAQLPSISKWVLIFAMFAGRLEIFTLIVLLTPAYWRK